MIDCLHPDISISRQADILDISRSSFYYKKRRDPEEVRITRAIDEIYTRRPFYGSRRMKDALDVLSCDSYRQASGAPLNAAHGD